MTASEPLRVAGTYYGHPFTGTVIQKDPNWEHGTFKRSEGVHLLVELDEPIEHHGRRERLFLHGWVDGEVMPWGECRVLDAPDPLSRNIDFETTSKVEQMSDEHGEKYDATHFVKMVASLTKWGERDEDGVEFNPSAGFEDSHECLMRLIDMARNAEAIQREDHSTQEQSGGDLHQVSFPVVVSVYEHRHGSDVGVHLTEDEATAAQAQAARTWWNERADQDAPDDHKGLSDQEVISAYFEDHETEFWSEFDHVLTLDLTRIPEVQRLLERERKLRDVVEETAQVLGDWKPDQLAAYGLDALYEHADAVLSRVESDDAATQASADGAEIYRVMALSTAHLTPEDIEALTEEARDSESWMVMEREPGFFIKLYGESPSDFAHGHSESIKTIIRYARDHGYQMIEFDRDAPVLEAFPVFEDAPEQTPEPGQ